ncbi:YafY family transcriptional regulator [Planctomonas sp. JC2975]|uniref:WYL domain-containing protein n=1 Tax=Planctomonas sp. JC2975 TaxID=2729626 RepID=UPI00147597BA|nr:YafY family transcriptional regulator [Planctomonas sp. JC2975]
MTRTDRLYALVEELRAAAPGRRSASWLANRFEVSVRTIERDIGSLQASGVPIWADAGRTGGYTIDAHHSLPPLGLSVDEAFAIMVGLGQLASSPFQGAARSASQKIRAVMSDEDVRRVVALTDRVQLLEDDDRAGAPRLLADALRSRTVLRIRYRDAGGTETTRDIEALGYVGKGQDWYLVAWCRLRGGVRAFRGDRVMAAEATGERPPARAIRVEDLGIQYGRLRPLGPE